MRGLLALLVAAVACGGPSATDRSGAEAEAPAPKVAEPTEAPSEVAAAPEVAAVPESEAAVELDPSAVRASRRAERLARGEVVEARFEGEFVSGGLPDEPTQAIPVGAFDLRFLLVVRVIEVLEGDIPGGRTDSVTFAVHSPAILFGTQGIRAEPEGHVPEGRYILTLWALPDGGYDLDVEPRE